MAFQLFRGTDAQVAAYTGADGELVYNMTNHALHINDGVTPGGFVFKTAEDMKTELLAGASAAYDTLKEIEDYINSNEGNVSSLLTDLATKAPKPADPTPTGQALAWNGTAFVNVVAGIAELTRNVVGDDVEYVFT